MLPKAYKLNKIIRSTLGFQTFASTIFKNCILLLGGVYMRKLAPARVLYRDDCFILYGVYMMTGSFHISLFEGTLHVDKIHVRFKIANVAHALLVPVYGHILWRYHVNKCRAIRGNRSELTPVRKSPLCHVNTP